MKRVPRQTREHIAAELDNGGAVWITYKDQGGIQETEELLNDGWSDYREVVLVGHRLIVRVRRTWRPGSEIMSVTEVGDNDPLRQMFGKTLRIRLDRVLRISMMDQDHHCYGGPESIWEWRRGKLVNRIEGSY